GRLSPHRNQKNELRQMLRSGLGYLSFYQTITINHPVCHSVGISTLLFKKLSLDSYGMTNRAVTYSFISFNKKDSSQ
ncbi:hypothetical protein, partial [Chryseobacterium ginsenosidimutans]|uniref:hypothetical protein n=1 Tax=Chryseobacterium ginsenosidimutans TaxID=687846 RepID=UPI0031D1FB64